MSQAGSNNKVAAASALTLRMVSSTLLSGLDEPIAPDDITAAGSGNRVCL
jgi:hypothetical protein